MVTKFTSPAPESADINLGHTYTHIRGHGYGKKAWIARIMGPDPKYFFFRMFYSEKEKTLSEDGKTGYMSFNINHTGLHEFRDFCVGDKRGKWRWSGFVFLHENGDRELLTKAEATIIAEETGIRDLSRNYFGNEHLQLPKGPRHFLSLHN